MPVTLKIARRLSGTEQAHNSAVYDVTDEEFARISLPKFREAALTKNFIEATDTFVYNDQPIRKSREGAYLLAQLMDLPSVKEDAFGYDGVVTVWSAKYLNEWQPPALDADVPPGIRLKITRILKGNKPQHIYSSIPLANDKLKDVTLSDLRMLLAAQKIIEEGDRFPHNDAPLEVREESYFSLAEVIKPKQKDGAALDESDLTIWSREYIEERATPVETTLTLTVKRKPAGLGDKSDKNFKLQDTAFNAMKLDALRAKLLALGYIAHDDQFVDQGVALEVAKEGSRDARSIAHDNAIVVWNKTEIDRMETEEKEAQRQREWLAKAPEIKVPEVDLKYPTLPSHEAAVDHTGDAPAGFQGTRPRVGAQVFSQLSAADMRAILTDSRLYPDLASAPCCAALTIGDEIEFARDHIVTCNSVRTVGVPYAREDKVEFTYSEEVAKWNRQLVTETSVGAHVPLLLGLAGRAAHKDAQQTFKKNVEVCLTASIALPKVRAVLDVVGVSDEFTHAVEETTRARDPQELLRLLAVKGHFIASDFLIGGKVVCSTMKVLEEDYSAQKLEDEFRLAAQGSIDAEGVPVTLDGGSGWKNLSNKEQTTIRQRYGLKARTYGGFGESSGSNPKTLGVNWQETVRDSPRTWTVIGVNGGIKPSLGYLPASLQKEAKAILRHYFDSKLTLQQAVAGNTGEKPWSDDLTHVRRIVGVNLHLGALVDGVQIVYEMNDNSERVTRWYGESRKELKPDASFRLEPGDEIVGVEVGYDKSVDHLIFWTRDKYRYPRHGQYGGQNAKHRTILNQARLRGFHGMAANYLDAFGVKYLDLTKELELGISKSALLSLERYIYSAA